VANAVWDGTDAVMLSAETATGQFPVLAVATMARIVETAEEGKKTGSSDITRWAGPQSGRVSRALCEAAAFAAQELSAKSITVITESGLMAHRLSALRPEQRIIALTPNRSVQNELALLWGTEAYVHPPSSNTEEMLKVCEQTLLDQALAKQGETIVMMAGRLSGLGLSSSVTLYTVGSGTTR
jgi:pyruvate kinase